MPTINTSLSANNNFRIDYITITTPQGVGLDITTELINFTMIETIDDTTVGTIIIQNRSNITGLLQNITGQEKIEISFASGSGNKGGYRKNIRKLFRVASVSYISDATTVSPESVISIELTSNVSIINDTNRISKNYDNSTSVSQIVFDILGVYFSEYEYYIENTAGIQYEFSFGMRKPYDLIQDLTTIAVSTDYKSSDFRFFENANGLNFVTTGNLTSKEPKFTFAIPPSGALLNGGASDLIPIFEFDAFLLANPKSNYKAATFGTNVMTTSIMDKSFEYTQVDRNKFDNERPYMNDSPTIGAFETIEQGQETYNNTSLYSGDGIYNNLKNDVSGHKGNYDIMERTRINSKRIMIVAPGFTDLTAGDTVNVNMLNVNNSDRSKTKTNTNISGKWLITAIKYNITLTEFNSEYTLINDSNIIL